MANQNPYGQPIAGSLGQSLPTQYNVSPYGGVPGWGQGNQDAHQYNTGVGNFGSTIVDNNTPPKDLNAPQFQGFQDYGDYQNFGAMAQRYGAAGAGQLNTPAVTGALNQTQAGANGMLRGQQNQNIATTGLGQAAQGHSASQDLLASAAQGNQPSAAEMQMEGGLQTGLSQAQSQAASTRGNFGLANAQKQAMAAQGSAASNAAALGGQQRAAEMAQAQQAYAQAQGQAQGAFAQSAGAQANNQLLGAQQNYAAQAQNQGTNLGYLTGQQQAYQNQAGMALGAAQGQANIDIGQSAQNTQQNIANQQITQGYVSGGAQAAGTLLAGAALLSDETTKRDIRGNAGDALSQLDQFKPVAFSYKAAHDTPNQQAADAPQVGVLAQDVEKGPAGRMLVQHTPDGRKALHIPSMVGAMAAGEGALKQRGDNHEERIMKLEALLRGGGGAAQPLARAS